MCVGMAGVAGTILAAYASLLGASYLPYLLAAAFMSAPGGILMAKMIMPDDPADTDAVEDAKIDVAETFEEGVKPANIIMAAAQGAQTGVKLAVAVGAMVLAFVALVALANGLLGGLGNLVGIPDLSFQRLVGYVFAPVMYLIGVPWNEAGTAGGLFGTKLVLNEFVAFIDLGKMGAAVLSDRSRRDRDLRSVRLCQLQLDRDPDGGDRRPRAQSAASDRQARHPGSAGRKPREPDVRCASGTADLSLERNDMATISDDQIASVSLEDADRDPDDFAQSWAAASRTMGSRSSPTTEFPMS